MNRKRIVLLALVLAMSGVASAQIAPREVDLTAADGVKLKATYYPAAKSGPGILLLHMCNSNRKAWATLAPKLAADGFHVLALDYRGYGESGGPRFTEIPADRIGAEQAKWPGDFDLAFSYLGAQPGVDKQRMGAAGGSCGVNNSVQLASRHPEVKTVVLLSGTTTRAGRDYLRRAAGMPVLGAASDDDGNAVTHTQWVLSFSANPNNRFLHYNTGGHGTDIFAVQKDLEPAIVRWFGQHLRNASTRPPTEVAAGTAPAERKTTAGISSAEFFDLLDTAEGAARALSVYEEARRKDPKVILFPESEINNLGYSLLPGNPRHAIDVFKLNVAAYPDSANVYDSLADGYVAAGERALAIEYSQKAIDKLRTNPPPNPEGADAIRQSAEQKLQQLRGGGGAPAPNPAAPRRGAPPPPAGEVFQMPVVYSVPGMDRAQVRTDVTYKTVDVPSGKLELKMDVYLPAEARANQKFPVVIFISGGGVDNPDWRKAGVYTSYGRLAAASGIVGVTYQKRAERGQMIPANAESDTHDLIHHLQEHAAEYSIDPDRIAMWAFSGGGLMLGLPLRERPPYIRAVLNFYAIADVLPSMPEEARRTLLERGFSPAENLKRSGNPLPAIFVGRAGYDSDGLNGTIDRFVQEALRQNATVEVMNHATGRHGFDILDPDERSREIIARAFAFLKAQFSR